jgi:hypothetical protein
MKAQQIIDAINSGEMSWDEVIILVDFLFDKMKQCLRLVTWG